MVSLVVFMTLVTHCIKDKLCGVIIMYNRSFGMYLLVSVGYKKKRKFYYWFSAMFFSKEKIIVSCGNLDNFTYDLPTKARVLQNGRSFSILNQFFFYYF
jgi:hypothetical protein